MDRYRDSVLTDDSVLCCAVSYFPALDYSGGRQNETRRDENENESET